MVAVVDFGGKEIQIPSNKLIGKTAFVQYEKGRYFAVSKDDFDKYNSKKSREYKKKETTNELIDKVKN